VGVTGFLREGRFEASLAADRRGGVVRAGADVRCEDIPLAEPVEELVALIAPAEGQRLRWLRAKHRPAGEVTGGLRLWPSPSGTDFVLGIERLEDVSFMMFDGRLGLIEPRGPVTIDARNVSTPGFSSRLTFDGEASGEASLAGRWSFAPDPEAVLNLSLTDGRIESPLVRSAAKRVGARAAAWMERVEARGEFTLDAEVSGPAEAPAMRGEIVPRSFAMVRDGHEVRFDRVSGRILFGTEGGSVEALRAEAEGWSLTAEGEWASKPGIDVDLRLGLESEGLPEGLSAMLPAEAARAFEATRLEVHGPFALREARVRTVNEGAALSFSAVADCGGSSLVVAVPIALDSARAAIEVLWPMNGSASPSVDMTLMTPRFEARGILLTEGRLRLGSTAERGVYELRELSALVHGGSMTATAMVRPAGAADGSDTAYSAEVRLLGVDFASVLNDLRLEDDPRSTSIDEPRSRGMIDATVTLAGTIGRPEERRGRGVARVAGGEVLALPGAMPLLRLSNLQPPIGEPLESASASFYMQGDTVTFDRLQVSSESLVILGEGTLTLPSTELNLRFNTEGRTKIPILDDILRGLRNEIVTTVVSGPVSSPEYRLEAFLSTQRMLGSIFRGSPAEDSAASSTPAPPQEAP
jgi:hypothetical protein